MFSCGASDAVSCVATVSVPGASLLLLVLQILCGRLCCGLGISLPRQRTCSAKKLFVCLLFASSSAASALLIEPWIYVDVAQMGTMPPPTVGFVGAGLNVAFWLLLFLAVPAEAQAGRVHLASISLGFATLLRTAFLAIGLGSPHHDCRKPETWVPWMPVEVALLLSTAAATAVAMAKGAGAASSARRATAAAASEALLPGACLPSDALGSLQSSSTLTPGRTARVIHFASESAAVGRSNGVSAHGAGAPAAGGDGGDDDGFDDEEDDDEGFRPGDDGERVLPRGIGCCQSLGVLHEAHAGMMAEAKAIQEGGDDNPTAKMVEEGDVRADEEDEAFAATSKPQNAAAADEPQSPAAGGGGGGNETAASVCDDWEPPPLPPIVALRKHLWRLVPKLPLAFGGLASILLTTASFLAPYFQGKLFDAAVDAYHTHQPVEKAFVNDLLPYLITIGGLYFLSWALEVAVGILFAVSAHTALTRLRVAMFANLIQQDVAFYDRHVSGELSSRLINDSGQLQTLTQFVSQNVLQAGVRITGGLVAMYLTHPLLAVLATVITPINWLLIRKAGKVQGMYGAVQNASLAQANAAAVESLGGVRTVHANTGELNEARRFAKAIRRFLHVVIVTVHTQTVVIFTQLLLSKMRDVAVLSVGMHQIVSGNLSIGAFNAFTQFVQYFEDGFSNAANIWLQMEQTLISAGRFVQLLERRPSVVPRRGGKPLSCKGELELRNVAFRYPNTPIRGPPVLKSFNLIAPPGSVIALVGASGAGKSTVARLIERFYDPTGGCVLLDGRDYRTLDVRWLRRRIGFVEQEPTLFDRSIAANVRYGKPHASFREVKTACELANAHEFISELPDGYKTAPGERGARISGGQKQRIAIARACLKKPSLLLLDEATSALDSANEAAVQAALDHLMLGRTTVVIAHRLSTVVRASQILVMHKGEVLEHGTHAELSARAGSHYATFMRHQLVSASQ